MEEKNQPHKGYSFIGDLILNISGTLLGSGQSRGGMGWWSKYRASTTPKERLKDAMSVIGFIGFFVFVGWVVLNKDSLSAPSVTTIRGSDSITVSGNCSWIYELYKQQRQEILDINSGREWDISNNFTGITVHTFDVNFSSTTLPQPICPVCEKCQECKECDVCGDCPICVECQPCECRCLGALTEKTKDKLYALKPVLGETWIYQNGFFKAKNKCLEALGLIGNESSNTNPDALRPMKSYGGLVNDSLPNNITYTWNSSRHMLVMDGWSENLTLLNNSIKAYE